MLLDVIFPLLLIADVVLLMACSPGPLNIVTAHIKRAISNRTGKHLIRQIYVMTVCAECKSSKNPENCTHMVNSMSGRKNKAILDDVMNLYPESEKTTANAELLGIQEPPKSILRQSDINSVLFSDRVMIRHPVRAVWIGIDPGGGGFSHMGVCVYVEYTYLGPNLLVVCLLLFFISNIIHNQYSSYLHLLFFKIIKHLLFFKR